MKFALVDREFTKRLKNRLGEDISRLEGLVSSAISLAPIRKSKAVNQDIEKFRKTVSNLYDVLNNSWGTCQCPVAHTASLRSVPMTSAASSEIARCDRDICDGVNALFSFNDTKKAVRRWTPRWNWHEVHLEPTSPPASTGLLGPYPELLPASFNKPISAQISPRARPQWQPCVTR